MASKKAPAKPKKSTPKKQPLKKRTPQLWDYVTREGHEERVYVITAMASDGLTCTLTRIQGRTYTNLEFRRVLVATLTCVEK